MRRLLEKIKELLVYSVGDMIDKDPDAINPRVDDSPEDEFGHAIEEI